MKQRIITSVIGLLVLSVVLFFYQTILLNIAIALVSTLAVYELLHSTGQSSNKALVSICGLFAFAVPFMKIPGLPDVRTIAVLIFSFSLFIILLAKHSEITIETLAFAGLFGAAVPFSLSSFIYLRDDHQTYGLYYIFLIFALAWICDAGAYFVGRKLGKNKLAPSISPNKTIEGAIGGIVTNVVFSILFTIVFTQIFSQGVSMNISYVALVVIAIICSFVGILGDLSASVIKRQHNIKDFGNIMPGHGGVVDRFDSIFFVAPILYVMTSFVQIINFI